MNPLPPPSAGAPVTLLPPPPGASDDAALVVPSLPRLPTLAAAPGAVEAPSMALGTAPAPSDDDRPVPRPVIAPVRSESMATARGFRVPRSRQPLLGTTVAGAAMLVAHAVSVACLAWCAHLAATAPEPVRGRVAETDDLARALPLLLIGPVTAAVLTAWWSGRVALNVQHTGVPARVGAARFAWFVPIWNWFGPFEELRKAPGARAPITAWQLVFIGQFIASTAFQVIAMQRDSGSSRTDAATTLSDLQPMFMVMAGTAALILLAAAWSVVVIRRNFAEVEAARSAWSSAPA